LTPFDHFAPLFWAESRLECPLSWAVGPTRAPALLCLDGLRSPAFVPVPGTPVDRCAPRSTPGPLPPPHGGRGKGLKGRHLQVGEHRHTYCAFTVWANSAWPSLGGAGWVDRASHKTTPTITSICGPRLRRLSSFLWALLG